MPSALSPDWDILRADLSICRTNHRLFVPSLLPVSFDRDTISDRVFSIAPRHPTMRQLDFLLQRLSSCPRPEKYHLFLIFKHETHISSVSRHKTKKSDLPGG